MAPTGHVGETLGEVRARLPSSPPGVVVFDDGVVAGTLQRDAFEADDDLLVDDVMRPDPTTVRPSQEVGGLRERMRKRGVGEVVVTRSDGRLVGIYRAD